MNAQKSLAAPSSHPRSSERRLRSNGLQSATKRNVAETWVDAAAVFYTVFGYLVAVYLVTRGRPLPSLFGALLLTHTMIWSALLTHEFIHRTFVNARLTNAAAQVMTAISGACYVPFSLLKQQHFSHHGNKVGYDGFAITGWVASLPPWGARAILALEYCYIPILSIIARWRSLALPFVKPEQKTLRPRIAIVLAIRASCLAAAAYVQPWSLLCFFIAQISLLNVLRVYDCFHHTFEVVPLGTPIPRLDRDYEQRNTYSSLLNRKRPWVNRLFLNYGYHNAHHARPAAHWLELPAIDNTLYPASSAHCILFPDLVRWYHRNRIERIHRGLGRPRVRNGKLEIDEFWGIIMNISFIVYDV